MNDLKLYYVSDKYINYLGKHIKNVYSNKEDIRIHFRKYLGVIFEIENFKYYIPLSSEKDTDYLQDKNGNFILDEDGNKIIRKDIIPIIRIRDKDTNGVNKVIATLRISNMIPVPDSEIELYDADAESDIKYKELVLKEIIFIRKNSKKIFKYANLLYKQKREENSNSPGYIKNTIDFNVAETKYLKYIDN